MTRWPKVCGRLAPLYNKCFDVFKSDSQRTICRSTARQLHKLLHKDGDQIHHVDISMWTPRSTCDLIPGLFGFFINSKTF